MNPSIVPLSGTDIRLIEGIWPLPPVMRASIPERWAALQRATPQLWDGRILGVRAPQVDAEGILRAEAVEDAYSAFLTWREAGFPEIGLHNLFGSALIASRDGALLYGVMGPETANAGRVYPPGGSLEPSDVLSDGRVDVAGSTDRELREETGLSPDAARRGRLVAVFDGPRISLAQLYHFDASAAELADEIRANLARQSHRELADIAVIRSRQDAERLAAVPYAVLLAEAFADGRLG